jgi:hypothetical protein
VNVMQRACMVAALVSAMLVPGASLFAGPSLHAKPLPEGRSFYITTIGFDFRVTKPLTVSSTFFRSDSSTYTTHTQPSGRHMISSELGIMRNLNPKHALGFSAYLGYDLAGTMHGGLNVRGRRWLDHRKSVDVTAGALLLGWGGNGFEYPGFVGTASMNFNDWENLKLTVTALNVTVYPATSQQTEVGAFLGYQIGGKPGFVTQAVVVLIAGLAGAVLAADPY